MKSATAALSQELSKIGEQMYKQQQGGGDGKKDGDGPRDAEFKEKE